MIRSISKLKGYILLALIVALPFLLPAQTFRGGISGTVLDPNGAVLSGTGVRATNEATGVGYRSETSSAGQFSFSDLPTGSYVVSTAPDGFKPYKVTGVTVNAGSINVLDIHLSIGEVGTTVEVSADTVALDTQSITQTTLLPSEAIHELGQHGGDFLATLALVPGYVGNPNQGNGTVNGARRIQVNFTIDGTDNNDPWQNMAGSNEGGIAPISGAELPLDAVQDFTFQVHGGAEAGRNSGGNYNATIKSGTNNLHGSTYYVLRNEQTAALSPFLTTKFKNRSSNWGGSVGGPIIKNKTFYFVALEKQSFNFNPGISSTEPGTGYQALARRLLSQYSVTENAVSTKLLNTLWPANALAVTSASTNNFFTPDNETGYSWNTLVKLDHTINDKNTLSARWYGGQGNQIGPSGSYLKSYYQLAPMHVQNYSAILNSAINSHSANVLQLGVSSFLQTFNDFTHNQDVSTLGLVTGTSFLGAPNLAIGSFDAVGVTTPNGRNATTGHLTDVFSYSRGKHDLRFGAEYRRVQVNPRYFSANPRGVIKFNGTVGAWKNDTKLSDGTAIDSYTKSLADFLAGFSSTSNIAYGNPERLVVERQFSFFVSDAWKLTRKLALNAGLRYENQGSIGNEDKNLSIFDPNKGLQFLGSGIDKLYPHDNANFGPRVGLTYTPSDSLGLVFRTGGGIYFDTPNLAAFLNIKASNGAAAGIQQNPGGSSPVYSVSQQANTIVNGSNFFQSASQPSTYGLFTISQSFRTPRSYQFYLQAEKSLGSNVVVQVGYVGTQARNQLGVVDINPSALNATAGTVVQSSRPYYSKFPQYAAINQLTSGFSSNYNALQATVRTKSWHHLTTQLGYNWGHNLDTLSSNALIIDNSNFKRSYGNADNDIRHSLSGFINYQLPAVPLQSNIVRGITKDWSLSTGINFHTGAPFTVKNSNSDTTGTGDYTQLVDVVGDPFKGVSHSIANGKVTWLNPAAFAAPAKGTYGNERRNQYFGPGYGTVDLTLSRSVRISDRLEARLRGEFYNVLNRTNYGTPSTTYNSGGSYGLITGTLNSGGASGTAAGEPFNAQFRFQLAF